MPNTNRPTWSQFLRTLAKLWVFWFFLGVWMAYCGAFDLYRQYSYLSHRQSYDRAEFVVNGLEEHRTGDGGRRGGGSRSYTLIRGTIDGAQVKVDDGSLGRRFADQFWTRLDEEFRVGREIPVMFSSSRYGQHAWQEVEPAIISVELTSRWSWLSFWSSTLFWNSLLLVSSAGLVRSLLKQRMPNKTGIRSDFGC